MPIPKSDSSAKTRGLTCPIFSSDPEKHTLFGDPNCVRPRFHKIQDVVQHVIKYHLHKCRYCRETLITPDTPLQSYSQFCSIRTEHNVFCTPQQWPNSHELDILYLTQEQEEVVLNWYRLAYDSETFGTGDGELWLDLYQQLHGKSFTEITPGTLEHYDNSLSDFTKVMQEEELDSKRKLPFLGWTTAASHGANSSGVYWPGIPHDFHISLKPSATPKVILTSMRNPGLSELYPQDDKLFFTKTSSVKNKCLACPFAKKDPLKHEGCSIYIMKGITDVKQHLLQYHQEPIHCQRCYRIFGTEEQLKLHVRSPLLCQINKTSHFESLTLSQRLQLENTINLKITIEQQWFEIFKILFPKEPVPESPFTTPVLNVLPEPSGSHTDATQHNLVQDGLSGIATTIVKRTTSLDLPVFAETDSTKSDVYVSDNTTISDLESNLSEALSQTSSLSSIEPVHSTAIEDLKWLLLQHKDLKPLYSVAISKVGEERFQKNFRRLLLRYGRALRQESENSLHTQAAKLVRFYATRIAFEIKESFRQIATVRIRKENEAARHDLNIFLKNLDSPRRDLDPFSQTGEPPTNENSQDLPSSDDESIDGQDVGNFQTLEGVKSFLISTNAFASLCAEFRSWLKLDETQEKALILETPDQSLNKGDESHNDEETAGVHEPTFSEIIQDDFHGIPRQNHEHINDDNTQDKIPQQWIANNEQLETTLAKKDGDTSGERFKDELGSLEEWFHTLSQAEQTATLYSLFQQPTHVQIRFFTQVLQQISKSSTISGSHYCFNTNTVDVDTVLEFYERNAITAGANATTKLATETESPPTGANPSDPNADKDSTPNYLPFWDTTLYPREKNTESSQFCLLLQNDRSCRPGRFNTILRKFHRMQDTLFELTRPQVPNGITRISWTCKRCGRRLYTETSQAKQAAALAFVQEAAGPTNTSSITIENPVNDSSSTTSKTTQGSEAHYSINNEKLWQRPISPVSSDSDEEQDPFIPAGTKKYMLLCVNTGDGLMKLANVDVTDVSDAEEVFKRLRKAYCRLRGSRRRNPLVKARTMHYVKFQLLSLSKSKECIGSYEINSIPSRKEIMRLQYSFRPCPPIISKLPLSQNLFMHSFLNPGDHLGPKAVEMLPKKLWGRLEWDNAAENGDASFIPHGWGFYILEDWDWSRIAWCAFVAVIVFSLTAVLWSILMRDVQGGMGIGQYCMGVLAVSMSIAVLLGREATPMSV